MILYIHVYIRVTDNHYASHQKREIEETTETVSSASFLDMYLLFDNNIQLSNLPLYIVHTFIVIYLLQLMEFIFHNSHVTL